MRRNRKKKTVRVSSLLKMIAADSNAGRALRCGRPARALLLLALKLGWIETL